MWFFKRNQKKCKYPPRPSSGLWTCYYFTHMLPPFEKTILKVYYVPWWGKFFEWIYQKLRRDKESPEVYKMREFLKNKKKRECGEDDEDDFNAGHFSKL